MPTDRGAGSARLLTIDQAADRLGVTPRMIRRLTSSRRLPYVKVGRLVRISEFEVGRFVEASTVAAIDRRDRYCG